MRRRARELAMRALFAHTVGGMGLEEAFQHALEEMGGEEEGYAEPLDQEGVAFARRLLSGYKAHQEEVDRVLEETVEGWDFRQMAKTHYGLDVLHYPTLPAMAMEALMKKSKQELELITDPDMFLFLENNIRGGISQISQRLGRANNKYLDPEDQQP